MGKRNGRRQCDRVTAEQGKLHAGLALGDAVTHGRDATRELRNRTGLARGLANNIGVGFERLMRG